MSYYYCCCMMGGGGTAKSGPTCGGRRRGTSRTHNRPFNALSLEPLVVPTAANVMISVQGQATKPRAVVQGRELAAR
jgi:hypothetical protein